MKLSTTWYIMERGKNFFILKSFCLSRPLDVFFLFLKIRDILTLWPSQMKIERRCRAHLVKMYLKSNHANLFIILVLRVQHLYNKDFLCIFRFFMRWTWLGSVYQWKNQKFHCSESGTKNNINNDNKKSSLKFLISS